MWTIVLIPLPPNAADPVSDFNSCKPQTSFKKLINNRVHKK